MMVLPERSLMLDCPTYAFDDKFGWTLADISPWSVWNCFHFPTKSRLKVENAYSFSLLCEASIQKIKTICWVISRLWVVFKRKFSEISFWNHIAR